MATTVETPEHRACRSNTNPERRGVEAALQEWRLGDANPRNLYVGNTHVGVIFDPGLSLQVVTAMNTSRDRDEQLRAQGRAQVDNAILWNTTCVGCADRLDGLIAERHAGADEAEREIAAALRAHGWVDAARLVETEAERGLRGATETPAGPSAGPSEGEPV